MTLPAAFSLLLIAGFTPVPGPTSAPDSVRVHERWADTPAGRYRYLVQAPEPTPAGLPVFVVLAGCTQTAEQTARVTGFERDPGRSIVVYVEQRPDANPLRCWNWFLPEHQGRAGEPAIIHGITGRALEEFGGDPDRTYVLGLSAGAAMALIAAVAWPERFAAVGLHSGLVPWSAASAAEGLEAMRTGGDATLAGGRILERFPDARRPPAMVIHGTADQLVGSGAVEVLEQVLRELPGPALTAVEPPARTAGKAEAYPIRRAAWADAGGAVHLLVWRVEGLGHAWSGGPEGERYADPAGPDAREALVRFLLGHRRP